jgi:cytochrome c peroxidase
VQRDASPEKFSPLDSGCMASKFDDLPDEFKKNVNTSEVPYDRRAGDVPALDDAGIDDVIAFLNTPNDGFEP